MNLTPYLDATRRDAQKHHDKAQETGDPDEYDKAADGYDAVGDFGLAKQCREAAARLRMVGDE